MLKYIIIGLVLISTCFASVHRHNSLIVAEYDTKDRGTGDYVNLVLYHFADGRLTSKDTILDVTSRITNYELKNSLLYKDRYVITPVGHIIDIQTKLMLKRERSRLYETRGDSLIFYKFFSPEYTEYYIYDLNKKYYEKVKDYAGLKLRGILSPNHKWGLEFERTPFSSELLLYDSTYNQDTIIISDCGIGTPMSIYSSVFPKVPLCWFDNENFLYVSFESIDSNIEEPALMFKESKSRDTVLAKIVDRLELFEDEGTATAIIHKFNIKSRSSEIIMEIDSIPLACSNAYFYSDSDGSIIFVCSKGTYDIKVEDKKDRYFKFKNSGFNFSIEVEMNPEYGRIIKYQNKEIGRVWCDYGSKTTDGFFSVAYGDVGSNLGYPKGVLVWNNITQKWTEIEINWLSSIVGWIEE